MNKIAGRDDLEKEFRESGDRFRDLVEGSIEGILIHRDLKPMFVNRAYAEILGFDSPEQVMALDSVLELAAPHLRAQAEDNATARLRGDDAPTDYEYEGHKKDGSTIWLNIRVRMIAWWSEPAILSTVVDISERKRAEKRLRDAHDTLEQRVREHTVELENKISEREQIEESLRNSEDRFKDFAVSVSGWFWEMDENLRFSYMSPTVERIIGVAPEWHYGKTREEILGDDYDRDVWDQHLQTLKARQPFRDFTYLRVGEGVEPIWLSTSGKPIFDANGKFLGYRGSGRDITERNQAEEVLRESRDQLRLVTDSLPINITRIDSEQRYRFANKCSGDWYACSSDDVIGKHVKEVMGSEYEKFRANVELALSGEAVTYELAASYPDGVTRDVRVTYVPDMGTDLRPQGFFSFVEDITESKLVEEQLHQSQKMEAVGQLTAGVAHDFNNMLAVISGNAELLEDELGKDNLRLATVHRATERAAELIQRLLAFSRRQVLKPEIINANRLIVEVTGLLRHTLEEDIDIQAVAAVGLWNCEVDPAQLENALVNLALNARDAMPDGGKLTIETVNARLDDDYAAAQADVNPGQYVMLAVTDTGTGMPPEVREHVFEPFFTTKAVGDGSGLGLSMVYGFVRQSGGHVTIDSEEGEGTTIKLYLPRSTETVADKREPVMDEVPVAQGETVLVVEDDPDLRTLAVALLSSLGYRIIEAATGAAALEELGPTSGVNLLLTDVVLPGGMNGRELATKMAQRVPGIQVLYMSGYTEDAIMHHGRLDADAELLQKPFRRSDLARAVRRVLDAPLT